MKCSVDVTMLMRRESTVFLESDRPGFGSQLSLSIVCEVGVSLKASEIQHFHLYGNTLQSHCESRDNDIICLEHNWCQKMVANDIISYQLGSF